MPRRNRRRFDREYAQLMINQPWGWGLYKPVPSTRLKPGTCGYFNAAGDWQPIVQLTDKFAVEKDWKSVESPLRVVTEKGFTPWGPKTSERVQTISFDLETGTQLPNVPANVSVRTKFVNEASSGAVLVTSGNVKSHGLNDGGSDAALMWMSANSEDILRLHERTLKEHGIWIVTKTYTSTNCGLAFLQSASASVEIGLTADAHKTLTISPSAHWSVATKGSDIGLYEDNKGRVVFMSGIYFTKSRFPLFKKIKSTDKQEKQDILRGGTNDLPRLIEKGATGREVDLLWTFYPPITKVDRDAIAQGQFSLFDTLAPRTTSSPNSTEARSTRQTTRQATLKSLEKQKEGKKRKQEGNPYEEQKGKSKRTKS